MPRLSVSYRWRNWFASQTNSIELFTADPEGSVTFKRSSPTLLCARADSANTSKAKTKENRCLLVFTDYTSDSTPLDALDSHRTASAAAASASVRYHRSTRLP